MSKIICDICGTSYADTATQCPICGCVRPAQPATVPEENCNNGGYTYVKGGRFSKSNVKKRTAGKKPAQPAPKEEETNKKGGAVLLIAIILIGIVVIGMILWATGIFGRKTTESGTPSTTPAPTTTTEPQNIPCEGLVLTNKQYTIESVGDTMLIEYQKLPADSTDAVQFVSENEEIAIVDSDGNVTAVQNGTTNIIITCGNVSETCQIIVGDGATAVDLELTITSIEFTKLGDTKLIYEGTIPADQITWTTSNEYIATVKDGVVMAEGPGLATITATYMDQTVSCSVRCEIEFEGGSGGITEDGGSIGGASGGIGEDGGSVTYKIHSSTGPLYWGNDITIQEGKSITLSLESSNGQIINVDWTCDENEHVRTEGSKIIALKKLYNNYIIVRTVYENITYSCIIRVS